MPEYIRRMSAMTICERYRQHCFESNDDRGQDIAERIFDEITETPTAEVVKVVRCKDCKHCHEYQKWNFDKYLGCNFNGEIYEVEPTHFCSYGELKESEGK